MFCADSSLFTIFLFFFFFQAEDGIRDYKATGVQTCALPILLRAFRRPWEDAPSRLWLLFALWAVVVVGFFTASPFKLPHHGLPAFPAVALIVARVWDETIDAAPGSARPRALLGPLLVLFALATIALVAVGSGVVRIPPDVLATLDGSVRRLAATGQSAPGSPLDAWRPLLARGAVIFGIGTVAMAVALWRRGPGARGR